MMRIRFVLPLLALLACDKDKPLPTPEEICEHAEKYGGIYTPGGGRAPFQGCVMAFQTARTPEKGETEQDRAFFEAQARYMLKATKPLQFRCLVEVKKQEDLQRCLTQI